MNVTWPCTKASHTFSRTFGTFSGTSLNLIWRLHQCTPELFWGEDPISLRCRGKTRSRINHTKQWWFQWMHRWAERIRNHSDPDHLPLLCKAMLFAAGIFFFGLGGVAAKELHESFSVQAALIAAAPDGRCRGWPCPCDQEQEWLKGQGVKISACCSQ